MPSEAQSKEPRDRGPPHPVTRAGRSALLAKAAASATPEKRPRGRPRKDGSTGRSVPPQPPPPPSPPQSRQRRRSRGKGPAEDEVSKISTGRKTPQKTEVKEVKEVKSAGRRRSSSRRKSNPEPDPVPDQTSPSPSPNPSPNPSPSPSPDPVENQDPGPTDSDSSGSAPILPDPSPVSPDPSPTPQDPSPSPQDPIPSHKDSPKTHPSSNPGSPVNSPVQSPSPREAQVVSSPRTAPSPSSPIPAYSTVPMEGSCSPVPLETTDSRDSPRPSPPSSPNAMEQSLVPSPVESPCPRVAFSPGEDEDSLSPLFQPSLSDSEDSLVLVLGTGKKRQKRCAFCYRGDYPPLGQGGLVVFGPTPGYIPLHILNRRTSPDRHNDCHDNRYHGNEAPSMCSSPDMSDSTEFMAQLGPMGLPHDINVRSLFDPTGQCCAHLHCAAWSEGVCRGEGQALLYVDKAIDTGSTQVCVFCGHLGASLLCRETGCGRRYHFPCAVAAATHLDWNQRDTLCSRHAHTVSSLCVLCCSVGNIGGQLMCCCCGARYHGRCLEPPLDPSPLCRAGWQCPQCRVCQTCRLRGDEALLVCELCDKSYHTHCLTPPLEHTPGQAWRCKNCRVCVSCGVRSSGQWANHLSLCGSCDSGLPCPICGQTADPSSQDHLICNTCYRCVHVECVKQGGGPEEADLYVCAICTPTDQPTLHTSISHMQALPPSCAQAPPDSPTPCLDQLTISETVLNHPSPVKGQATPPQCSPTSPPQSPPTLQCNPAHIQHSPTNRRSSPARRECSPTHPLHSPTPCPLQQSPTQVICTQTEKSPSLSQPAELHSSPTTHSPTLHSPAPSTHTQITEEFSPTEAECRSAEQSPGAGIPICPPTSPPQQNPTQSSQASLASTEPPQSPTPRSPTEPQHSPAQCTPQTQLSPMPIELQCSPMQCSQVISPSPPTSPTQDTLDQDANPNGSTLPSLPSCSSPMLCEVTQEISTLDQASLSPDYCGSTRTRQSHICSRPYSAPCSPSQTLPRPTHCSLSQPASPTQAPNMLPITSSSLPIQPAIPTQKSAIYIIPSDLSTMEPSRMQLNPSLADPTLERNLGHVSPNHNQPRSPISSFGMTSHLPDSPQSITGSPLHSSPSPSPITPAPESLIQVSTSLEHTNLTSPTCTSELVEPTSPTCTSELVESTSPTHADELVEPTSPTHADELVEPTSPTCTSKLVESTSPTHASELVEPTSPTHAGELVKSTSPTHAGELVEPTSPTHISELVEPTSPTHASELVEPISPTHASELVEHTSPTHASELVEPISPTHARELAEPISPTHASELAEPISPTHASELVEATCPTHASELVEPTSPTHASELLEPSCRDSPSHAPETIEPTSLASQTNACGIEESTTLASPTHGSETVEATSLAKPTHASEMVEPTRLASPTNANEIVESTSLASPIHSSEVEEHTSLASPTPVSETVEPTSLASPILANEVEDHTSIASPIHASEVVEQTSEVEDHTNRASPTHASETVENTGLASPSHASETVENTGLASQSHASVTVEHTTLASPSHASKTVEPTRLASPRNASEVEESTSLSSSTHASEVVEQTCVAIPTHSGEVVDHTSLASPTHSSEVVEQTSVAIPIHSGEVVDHTSLASPTHSSDVEEHTRLASPNNASEDVELLAQGTPIQDNSSLISTSCCIETSEVNGSVEHIQSSSTIASEMTQSHTFPAQVSLSPTPTQAAPVHNCLVTVQARTSPLSTSPIHPSVSQDEDMDVPPTSPSHANCTLDSPVNSSPTCASPISLTNVDPSLALASIVPSHACSTEASPTHITSTSSPTHSGQTESVPYRPIVASPTSVQTGSSLSDDNRVQPSSISMSACRSPFDPSSIHSPESPNPGGVTLPNASQKQGSLSYVNSSDASSFHTPGCSSTVGNASPPHITTSPCPVYKHSSPQASPRHASLVTVSPQSPVYTNETCASTTQDQFNTNEACASPTQDQFNTNEACASPTQDQFNTNEACASPTKSPAHTSEACVSPKYGTLQTSEACVSPSQIPVHTSEACVSPTQTPIQPSEACVSPTQTPIQPSEACVSSTQTPVYTNEAYVSPIQAHIQTSEACVSPTQTPVHTNKAYVSPTQTLVHTSEACASPTQTYNQTSEACVSPTESPIHTDEACLSWTQCSDQSSPPPESQTLVSLNDSTASSPSRIEITVGPPQQISAPASPVEAEPTESNSQVSLQSPSPLHETSSTVTISQASLSHASHASQATVGPSQTHDSIDTQERPAMASPIHTSPASPVDASSTPTSPAQDTAIQSSSTEGAVVMPSPGDASKTPESPMPSVSVHTIPTQVNSPQTSPSYAYQASSAVTSPTASPVSSCQCGDSTGLASPQQDILTQDILMEEETDGKEDGQPKGQEREVIERCSAVEQRELNQKEIEKVHPHQQQAEEEEQEACGSSNKDEELSPSLPGSEEVLSMVSPLQTSSSPSSQENSSSPVTSSHRMAIPLSPSPLSTPQSSPLEYCPQDEEEVGSQNADTALCCHLTTVDDSSQSESLSEPAAVSMTTKSATVAEEVHQSQAGTSKSTEEKERPMDLSLPEMSEQSGISISTTGEAVAGQQPIGVQQEDEEEKLERQKEESRKGEVVEEEKWEKQRVGDELVQQEAEDVTVEEVTPEEAQPRSPVLELNSPLDMEVLELMTSFPPPSLLQLASHSRGRDRTLRLSPRTLYSCRPSDDLSLRLRMSPFSAEASPETSPARTPVTPPPLSPLSPPPRSTSPAPDSPQHKPQVPPTTVLPLTPRIGMGKPAITKRKFSPGRPRVKQGSWWSNRRAVSPPSSSQDSMGEGGWNSPKPRPPDSPLWSMRVGRGSGFPGRRRARGGGVGGGRGGRGRSRMKTQDSLAVSPGAGHADQLKDDEENSMHNTVVMFSATDHFTLKQDMCVVCGSFGQGAEGRLLACSQCGQCYHPYCVNIKITRVILTKGWRCLECTVCEACGEASDPGRLLLCDDCDISYHTYCLDPPLHTVPKGAWKCKWCVWCVQCGSTSPGGNSDWQKNYSQCGPCASLSHCPVCQRAYTHLDLILQCQHCDRWVHAICQGLSTDEEVESAADRGFDCSLCRPRAHTSYGRSDSYDSPYMAQIIPRGREPELRTYTQDGVCLTESGLTQLQTLVEPLTSPRRYRKSKPKLKLRIINQNSVSVLQTPPDPEPLADGARDPEQNDTRGEMECEGKSDSSPERDHGHDEYGKGLEVTDGNKKRKRKPYRPGIGGFMVRQRGGKAGPGAARRCQSRVDSTGSPGREEGWPDSEQVEKVCVKKRYRKKKTQLEEAFPSYLQEAFFGRDLLDRSRQQERRMGPDGEQPGNIAEMKSPTPSLPDPSPSNTLVAAMATGRKQGALLMSDEALVDLSEVLTTDTHTLAPGRTGLDICKYQMERSLSPFAGLDMLADDGSLTSGATGSSGRGQRTVQEESLDAILSPELDRMVSDGAILSRLYNIPELEGKDVEDLFTAVLSPSNSTSGGTISMSQPVLNTHTGNKTLPQPADLPVMNGLMGATPHFPTTPMMPSGQADFRPPPADSNRKMNQLGGDVIGSWGSGGPAAGPGASASASSGETEHEGMSTAQRSMLKWEKEEVLGELATVAPVLYANINHPELKEQYPDWSSRVKQIAKLWRKASSQDRAPYVQKARDNRAALRINKVQLSNDSLRRSLSQVPAGPLEDVAMDTESRDPLRPRESQQEQEWRLRQGELNDSWGSGKKRQENLLKSKALKSPTDKDCPYQASVAGGGKEALQQRQMFKQQAKIEACQKLEQVKIEQLRQQQQQQQQLLGNQILPGGISPETGSRSPMATPQQPVSGGKNQGSGLADDVFLRPQAPPPSSPQVFSPPSSRPSSPWDPYSKIVGTPRPPSAQQHRLNAASPAHDTLGSCSPDYKPQDPSRSIGAQQGTHRAPGMMSPSSSSASELPPRSGGVRSDFQRGPGGLFKAPMPLYHQSQQERSPIPPSRALDMDPSSSPLSGLGSPHRTPRPEPSPDPYSVPQTPGTPRPHADPAYLPSPALRLDQLGQQVANRRPSPSLDPYASMPGTPRPSDRFPRERSPGSQPATTPRPSPDPYSHAPGTPRPTESFPAQPGGPGLSPLHQTHQQSPGRLQQPRTPGGHTPKHPGMSDEGSFSLGSQTPAHDAFEQGHVTPGPVQTDKTAANEMTALGGNPLEGPIGMLPQLGDSEEKLRQRQRLRQLLLRQQQQKSLRQEGACGSPGPAGPSGPGPGPGPGPGTPRHWSQEDPQIDLYGRPPPPYPGPGRGRGAFIPSEGPYPRQGLPREGTGAGPPLGPLGGIGANMGVRPPIMRFSPAGLQQSLEAFQRAPLQTGPGVGLVPAEGGLALMSRPLPGDFPGIRPITAPSSQPHPQMMTGRPQPFLPRTLPMQPHGIMGQQQQHNIMGQPFIELRHRAPGGPIRPPFPVAPPLDPSPTLGLQSAMEQLSQQAAPMSAMLGHHGNANAHSSVAALPGPDGIDEHLEGEDSAVKDLEDVEVKDLVDLNLNLDPEDGKEDLDLGPNDLHLDDFLLSGKFDLIAYADPELNLEDKKDIKDMFSDELDLGEGGEETRKTDSHAHPTGQVKQEVRESVVTSQPSTHPAALNPTRPPGHPGASNLLTQEKREVVSGQAPRGVPPPAGQPSAFPTPPSQQPRLLLSSPPQVSPQPPLSPSQASQRPLLLEEQPLLLQDLLDQERQEQQQQRQMQTLMRQRPDNLGDSMDFDSISDPIMKAKMVALQGINKVMTQSNLGLNPLVINRLPQAPGAQAPAGPPPPPQILGQDGKLTPQLARPAPPSFAPGFVNEAQRRQYEEWLGETQRLLLMQQKYLEDQITGHRKAKKALSAKQRTAKKAGRPVSEDDTKQMQNLSQQQGALQKQLEQIKKQQKDHTELIEDYTSKQQQQQQQSPIMPPAAPPPGQPMLGTPLMPLPPRPAGPAPAHIPNIPPGWRPAPPQHAQAPVATVPSHAALSGGFTQTKPCPPGGAAGAPAANAHNPQVKFDDNNPFSEGFQERERRERLREQQERQRRQLLQEVERQRALQQRLDVEQPGLLPGARVGPGAVAGSQAGSGTVAGGESLLQMPFFSSELPQDFLQSPPTPRAPQQTSPQQAYRLSRPLPGASLHMARHPGPAGVQGQVRPAGTPPSQPAAAGGTELQRHPFRPDSSPSSMLHLYPDLHPEDGRRRNRRTDDDSLVGGARTPLSSHSDDITAPPTPAFSDTSCSTPTRGAVDPSDVPFPPSSSLSGCPLEVKEEKVERGTCGGVLVKTEDGAIQGFSSPPQGAGGDAGKELLKHLLKGKSSPATTLSPINHGLPACRRMSSESLRSEEEDVMTRPGPHDNYNMVEGAGMDGCLQELKRRQQRGGGGGGGCKRGGRVEREKQPKAKRRKREDEEKIFSSSTDALSQLKQLSVLPLMEPVFGVNLSLFPPYGCSSLERDSRLSGCFGNACLDGVTDYYSQLIYKNNLSNPPTPPASLPPTPPPVARQKIVNGFASTDELVRNTDVKNVSGLKQKGEELVPLNHASRMVDVPASLPTPPHNNQEELRVQEACPDGDRDSPHSLVPPSSPESDVDEISRYPDLSWIKLESPSPCPSPTIPIMPCAWGKGSAIKQEVKAEPNPMGHPSCSPAGLVSIAISLTPAAAQNIPGVMAAVANLLRVPVPTSYQLSHLAPPPPPSTPDRSNLALLASVRVPLHQGADPSRLVRPPGAVNTAGAARPQCCQCKGLLGNAIRLSSKDLQEGSSLLFCSIKCRSLYASSLVKVDVTSAPQHRYTSNMSSIAVHCLPSSPLPPPSSPPLSFPPAAAVTMETKPKSDSLKVTVKLKPHPRAVSGGDESLSRHGKRIKGSRWRRWSVHISLARGPRVINEAVAMPTEEEMDALLKNMGACLCPDPLPKDQRRCCFCHQQGDGRTDGPARLLNLDLDLWVHLNCALWSSEVYETQAGALINVELALRRGFTLRCAYCQQTGATSGCNRLRCSNTYHFTCALQANCTFFKDKTMLCHLHKPRMGPSPSSSPSGSSPSGPAPPPDPYDCELRCFAVLRRVYVQRDEARQIAAVVQRGQKQHRFRIGALLFRCIGRLLPQQIDAFHNQSAIFPPGYHANRIYWSMRHSNRRCKYMCSIEDQEGQPLFKVKVVEKGYDDLTLTGTNPKAVWEQVLGPVAELRTSAGMLKLFPIYLKGEDLFGLTTSAVTRILESLPGVEACDRYTFRFGRNPLMEWPLAFNPTGSARSEPKPCQAKRPSVTNVAPRCAGSVGPIVGLVPGVISLSPGESVAVPGRHSKSSQYRRMKAEWKSNVYLARSRIQGLGLYAARDIEKCTMVIEYIGTIIRSEVANRKERVYESQNRGVYMFRIDNDYVIDATITGGPARYINHCCAPNCITEVVSVERENKIIISSCRRIQRGEELCYDYKFDLEDDQHKIPCHCGAVNCRKWMN